MSERLIQRGRSNPLEILFTTGRIGFHPPLTLSSLTLRNAKDWKTASKKPCTKKKNQTMIRMISSNVLRVLPRPNLGEGVRNVERPRGVKTV